MNGNVALDFHWLPPRGSHSGTSEVYRERRRPLDGSQIRLRREDLYAFFFFPCLSTGAERGPAGFAAAVGLHPRVWRLGLHWRAGEKRRHASDGEKETKRRKFFNEVSKQFELVLVFCGGLPLENLLLQFILEANPAFFQCPRWSKFVFFLMHRERGELSR